MPIFYLFGKTDDFNDNIQMANIPDHPNVSKIIANCGDYYEDIPMKMYHGFNFYLILNLIIF